MDGVAKSALGTPYNPTTQTANNIGFTVRSEECQKSRLAHSKLELKREESKGAQRIIKKLSYICAGSPSEYIGPGDRDEKVLEIFFRLKIFHAHQRWHYPTTLLIICNRVHLLWRWWHSRHIKQISGAISTVPKVWAEPNRTQEEKKNCSQGFFLKKKKTRQSIQWTPGYT